jgi:hypothetical protein
MNLDCRASRAMTPEKNNNVMKMKKAAYVDLIIKLKVVKALMII